MFETTTTPYEKLYENLLPKFKRYEIPLTSKEEVEELLHDYLLPAVARFHVCKQDLTDRDEELKCFNCALSDKEIDILSNYMLLEYIDSNDIRTSTLLKVSLSSSDFNAFSPANFLDKLMQMHDKFTSENETYISRYSWTGITKNSMDKFKFGNRRNNS